jgi:hypothetical protein
MDSATKAFVCSELAFVRYRAIMQPACYTRAFTTYTCALDVAMASPSEL